MHKSTKLLGYAVSILMVVVAVLLHLYDDRVKDLKHLKNSYILASDFITENRLNSMSDQAIFEIAKSDDKIVQSLYQMLKDITKILENNGIIYSIDGGTLLGAVRHGGLIPWDDDIDLFILQQDEVKLNRLQKVFNAKGYAIIERNSTYKIYKRHFMQDNHPYPAVDIFVAYSNSDTRRIEYYKLLNKKQFPYYLHEYDNCFPLKRYQFGSLKVYGPADPVDYLNRVYGKDWAEKIHITTKHKNSPFKGRIVRPFTGVYTKVALPLKELL